MNDFLQFVDRVPTLPNRKKITHADSSIEYATIEYADDPVTTGTPLNKANFNKLNMRLGYNDVTGLFNPTTTTAEFTLQGLSDIDLVDNQIIDLQCKSEVMAPATDWNIVKTTTAFTNKKTIGAKVISLSNGNTFVWGTHSSSSYCYISIIDNTGNFIVQEKQISGLIYDAQLIELDNGNIFVGGRSTSPYSLQFAIFNNLGETVKQITSGNNYYESPKAIKLNDGNIFIAGGNNDRFVCSLISQTGEIIRTQQSMTSSSYVKPIQSNNGNILVFTTSNLYVLDSTIQTINRKSNMAVTYPSTILLDNDNIFAYGSGSYKIVNQSGTLISSVSLGDNYKNGTATKMANGNIIIVGNDVYESLFIKIIRQDETLVKELTNVTTGFAYPQVFQMSNGNILIFNEKYQMYGLIIDTEGNIIKTKTSLMSLSLETSQPNRGFFISEYNNKNLIIVGSVSDYSYYIVIKPISTGGTATLNGILLDTLLQKDKYYELIYNQSQNKFIAEEVRNAN